MSNIHFVNNINEVSNLPRRDRVQFKCTNCGSIGEASVNNVFYKQRLLCNACSKDIGKKEFLAKKNSMSPEEYLMSKSTKFISSLDEIKDVVGRKFITFKCTKCGALAGNVSDRLKQKGLLLCGDCMKKHTNLERFGYEHPMFDPSRKEAASMYNKEHKEEINESRRLSVLNKYGVNNVMQVQEHKDACFESNRNNHGGILASQTEEQRQLQSERMIENHGYSDKATATNIANHGGVHNLTLPENREKLYEHQRIHKDEIQSVRDETNIKRFGKTNYMNSNYDYNWLQSLYYRNLIRFAFSRYTFQPLYCNTMNNGKGVTPFDVDMKQKYAPVTGKGLTPFDIKFPKKD